MEEGEVAYERPGGDHGEFVRDWVCEEDEEEAKALPWVWVVEGKGLGAEVEEEWLAVDCCSRLERSKSLMLKLSPGKGEDNASPNTGSEKSKLKISSGLICVPDMLSRCERANEEDGRCEGVMAVYRWTSNRCGRCWEVGQCLLY